MLIFNQHCFSICCWSIHWNVIFHQHSFCSCGCSIHWNVIFSLALFLYLWLFYTLKWNFFTSIVSLAVAVLYIEMLFFHQHWFCSCCGCSLVAPTEEARNFSVGLPGTFAIFARKWCGLARKSCEVARKSYEVARNFSRFCQDIFKI